MAQRAWAPIALDYYDDPIIDTIADEHPEVLALWPILILRCVEVSHVQKNPRGLLETTVGKFARILRVKQATVAGILDLLEAQERIRVERDGPALVIEVLRFDKYQSPRGSSALKMKWKRRRDLLASPETGDECDHGVTSALPTCDQPVTNPLPSENPTNSRECDPDVTSALPTCDQGVTSPQPQPIQTNREGTNVPLSETSSDDATPPRRVKKRSTADVERDIANCRQALGKRAASLVDDLVDVMAGDNKTGQVAASRVLRELWRPVAELSQDEAVSADALVHGLSAAVRAGAANVRYVRKAALGYRPDGVVAPGGSAHRVESDWSHLTGGGAA